MTILDAILLGIVQGLSEFLPISSTGHLTLTGKLMGVIDPAQPEHWTAFIAVMQLGTLVSVLIYFYKDITAIITEFLRDNLTARKPFAQQSSSAKMGWMIIGGTIPIVVIGLTLKKVIEGSLTKNLWVIGSTLILLAIILAVAEKVANFKREMKDLTMKDAILMGIAQSFALIPGSSRSGTTITMGLFIGLTRDTAARFSFLLSIPAIFASGLLELVKAVKDLDSSMITNLAVSTVVAGISGYMAIDFLLKYLKKNSTFIFIYYRIALGVLILFLLWKGIINP